MRQGSVPSEVMSTPRTVGPLQLADYQITVTLNLGLSVLNRGASQAAPTQYARPTRTRLV